MTRSLLTAATALVVGAGALAQSTAAVWASVAYVYHGERVPLVAASSPVMTPLGAHQMLAQGALFRARYLDGGNKSRLNLGGSGDALDNTRLTVLAGDDAYLSSSAMAFMQGLYPPMMGAMAASAGGMVTSRLANGTIVDYPLGGYQYPQIQTFSTADTGSVWIQGHLNCPLKDHSAFDLVRNPEMKQLQAKAQPLVQKFYHGLLQSSGLFDDRLRFLQDAYDIYDFVRYNYTHDNVTQSVVPRSDMEELQSLVAQQQRELHGNQSVSGSSSGDMIRAIAGRTVLGKVAAQLRASTWSGVEKRHTDPERSRFTAMFGSHEPLVALFSLLGLWQGNSDTQAMFQNLPRPGSVVVFEAFTSGDGNDASSEQPPAEDLLVRFLYESGDATDLVEYPIFGRGNQDRHMRYIDFMEAVDAIDIVSWQEWCVICGNGGTFCPYYSEEPNSLSPGVQGLGLTAAGAIGAAVAVVVAGVILALVAVLRAFKLSKARRPHGSLGNSPGVAAAVAGTGFRGVEKKKSDRDMAVGRDGGRHERCGSWELGCGSSLPRPQGHDWTPRLKHHDHDHDHDHRCKERDKEDNGNDSDASSLFGASPVEPRTAV